MVGALRPRTYAFPRIGAGVEAGVTSNRTAAVPVSLPVLGRFARLHRLDLAVYRRATQSASPRVDRILYPLSKAANHSKIWVGVAALLYAKGGRANRRAALRGVLSVAATSAITNAVVKPIASRPRPTAVSSEWLTRVARVPASTSFPSGHSASAAAFAVGVGMEVPELRVPLGLAAGAVGWSRVRTRVHYPGDVVAGLVIGAGIAYATRRFWALRPDNPAEVRPPRAKTPRAATDGEGLGAVINPSAGSGSAGGLVDDLQAELPQGSFVLHDDDADLLDELNHAASHDVLGIVGGDGSVNAAASVALHHNKPLAVFPGGTLNHFARDLGLETIADTVEAIRARSLGAVDMGMIDDQPFLNTASFGSYAALVDAREEYEERLGKWPAMLIALVKVLRTAKSVDVTINGTRRAIWLIFVGNGEYGPPGLAPSWRAKLDDGLFDVRYVEDTGPYSRLRLIAAIFTGQLTRTDTYTRELVDELEIESHDGPLRLARDGETHDGPTRFTIRKHDTRLAVYVQPRD
jgi:diacylglycerol kinase family enzyme/membrane-associated phospholipid phosphatase